MTIEDQIQEKENQIFQEKEMIRVCQDALEEGFRGDDMQAYNKIKECEDEISYLKDEIYRLSCK